MKIIFILIVPVFLFMPIQTLLAKATCKMTKYTYKIKGVEKTFKKKLCQSKLKNFYLIYSPECALSTCDLVEKLKATKGQRPKKLLGKGQFGAPQFLKCRSIDGRPETVTFEKTFLHKKTMLCFSKVDDSIMNTDAIYRWFKRDKK